MTDAHRLESWKGCERPPRIPMQGNYARLEPLSASIHGDGLFDAVFPEGEARRFHYLPEYPPESRADFQPWLEMAEGSLDPLFFVVIDVASKRIAGRQTLMRIDPANGVIEIGHILWTSIVARQPAATEAFFLFARHVFDDLGYRRFEWKCDDKNTASKHAAARFGMKHEGVFRQAAVVKGRNRDTAWFSVIDEEWPNLRAGFEKWLDPANFDRRGIQKKRLSSLLGRGAG